MKLIAIDPGPDESAYVVLNEGLPVAFAKLPNAEVIKLLMTDSFHGSRDLVIEQVASFGMAVGADIFETVFWSGRFAQTWEIRGGIWHRLKRIEVKMALCHDSRAKDGNIRQAIIDRYGGKDVAIGRKRAQGPLFGVSGDMWSALAVAIAFANRIGKVERQADAPLFAEATR